MPTLITNFRHLLSVLMVALLLYGCGATGGAYREHNDITPNTAQVVIYRPDIFFQSAVPYQVKINGKEAILRNGGFVIMDANPGTVFIEVRAADWWPLSFDSQSFSFDAAAKSRAFVRITPVRESVRIRFVSSADATSELKTLKESQ